MTRRPLAPRLARTLRRWIPVLSAVWLVSGCGGRGEGLRSELQGARDRWAEADLGSYAVTERRGCFCPPPVEWTVVVTGGTPSFIESVEGTGTTGESEYMTEQRALDESMSVEELFDWIEERIGNVARLDVTFDAALGFPTRVEVDPLPNAIDDEITWELSNVMPTPFCTEIGCHDGLMISLHPPAGGFAPGSYEVRVTPVAGGSPATCAFTVTTGGSCAAAFCVQNSDCAHALSAADRIEITLPIVEGTLDLTVSIDGGQVASETIEPDYTRSQPNGPLCPPVCWWAQHDVTLP